MKICIYPDRDNIISTAVNTILDLIQTKKQFVLGLSTGLTVLDICENLAQQAKKNNISFKHVTVFIAGEFVGYSQNTKHFYIQTLYKNFFSQTDILSGNIHSINGKAEDLIAESERYEQKIINCGGIDLFVGSFGANGNVAFNEPGSSLSSRTRIKTLTLDTLEADARFFSGDISKVPSKAITMGLGTISDARQIIIVVYGIQKAFVLQQCLEQGVSDSSPASIFQYHPNVFFMVDKVAGRFLNPAHNERIKEV